MIELMMQMSSPFYEQPSGELMAMENGKRPVRMLDWLCHHDDTVCVECVRTWRQDWTLESVRVTSDDGSVNEFKCSWDDLQEWAEVRTFVDPPNVNDEPDGANE